MVWEILLWFREWLKGLVNGRMVLELVKDELGNVVKMIQRMVGRFR